MISKYLDSKEAAEMCGISLSLLYKLSMNREIPHKKIFGRLRFVSEELEDWLSARTVRVRTKDELSKVALEKTNVRTK